MLFYLSDKLHAFQRLHHINTVENGYFRGKSLLYTQGSMVSLCLPNGGQSTTPLRLLRSPLSIAKAQLSPWGITPYGKLTTGPKEWWIWEQGWGRGRDPGDVSGRRSPFKRASCLVSSDILRGNVSVLLWMGPLLLLSRYQGGGKSTVGLRNNESAYIFFLPKKSKVFPQLYFLMLPILCFKELRLNTWQ